MEIYKVSITNMDRSSENPDHELYFTEIPLIMDIYDNVADDLDLQKALRESCDATHKSSLKEKFSGGYTTTSLIIEKYYLVVRKLDVIHN